MNRAGWRRAWAACCVAAVALWCSDAIGAVPAASSASPSESATSAPSGEWPTVAHDTQGTRFSPLDQINASNVRELKLAFSFPTGIDKGHEAAPLVIGASAPITIARSMAPRRSQRTACESATALAAHAMA